MQPTEQKALMTLAMLAAFADGRKDDREREELRRVAESLQSADASALNVAAIYQDVLLRRVDVTVAASQLGSPELRQLAFELAVGVCDADGLRNEQETRFLAGLGEALGLSQPQMAEPAAAADALATVPLEEIVGAAPSEAADTGATTTKAPVPMGAGVGAAVGTAVEAEIDASILNYAILNGALELLPQSMASMAIIPLQMKMVYGIGKRYGYELDRGHVKDFLATVGVGLTGQYLEEIGRKLIGGLFGKAAGRMVGGLARGATGMAFSFATTYALGHVAKRYYAGGRSMNTQMLKDAFAQMLGQAQGLQARYQPQIEQQSRSVDVGRLVQLVRSQ